MQRIDLSSLDMNKVRTLTVSEMARQTIVALEEQEFTYKHLYAAMCQKFPEKMEEYDTEAVCCTISSQLYKWAVAGKIVRTVPGMPGIPTWYCNVDIRLKS